MRERGDRLGLALETRDAVGIACEEIREDRDRDVAMELRGSATLRAGDTLKGDPTWC